MDEHGETPTIYVWPIDHEPGEPLPEDFSDKLREALNAGGFDYEWV